MQKYFERIIYLSEIKLPSWRFPAWFFSILILVIHLSFFITAFAKEKSSIAVMDFSSEGIPVKYKKIIRSEIEYNLYKDRDFRVLEREKIDIVLKEKKIREIDSEKRSVMITVGKTLSADYVLTGDILKGEKDNIYIVKLRIINISNGVVLYAYSKSLSDLTNVKGFTKSISENVISDIKYYDTFGEVKVIQEKQVSSIDKSKAARESVVTNEKKPVINEKSKSNLLYNIAIMPEYIRAFGAFRDDVDYGYGLKFYIGIEDIFFENTGLGIESGIIKLERSGNAPGYFLLAPVLLSLKYSYFFYADFFLAPEIKAGPAYLSYKCDNNEHKDDYSKNIIEMMSQGGLTIGKKICGNINIGLSTGCGVFFEKKKSMYFFIFGFNVFIYL